MLLTSPVHVWHELRSMLRGWLEKQLTASLHGSTAVDAERVAGKTADRFSAWQVLHGRVADAINLTSAWLARTAVDA